jgi:gas vesicle protein
MATELKLKMYPFTIVTSSKQDSKSESVADQLDCLRSNQMEAQESGQESRSQELQREIEAIPSRDV